MDYKDTLNLPRTDFPMRAALVEREPQRLKQWEDSDLYQRIQKSREDAEAFLLHDGPPFANGDVHIGTALNKILKDIIIKYETLRGRRAPYVPGWDCHGLPIEFKVVQEMRKKGETDVAPATIRKACEAYARKYIDQQRGQFKRLGVFGEWDQPYLTLNPAYEAEELRLFADLVDKGFIYRGKKPVYWSIPCQTALAEAEVEYQDHVSQSVYVKFPVVDHPGTFILIWTTTPWTLPANLAVAYNSTFDYSLVQVDNECYLVSAMLLDKLVEKAGWGNFTIVRTVRADELSQMTYQHPFCHRTGKLFAGDHFVENTTGTGFVHIAPGHGADDYQLGLANGLPVYSPVDDEGRLARTTDLPEDQQMPDLLVGKSILDRGHGSEANEAVLGVLEERDVLIHREDYHHSYPHCWRSKTPVIFRAMDQWFVRVDHEGFRDRALEEIRKVTWVPDWGVNRIEGAVQSRPDWCISRQRSWGVPIPAFIDADGVPILDARIVRKAADLVEKQGSNAWYEMELEDLWNAVCPEDWSGPSPVGKALDTLDVWIDSGSSSRAVIARRKELRRGEGTGFQPWQADVYLEGSDQHRGWFQSSLLLSLAGNGSAPFRTVLTHGFMVDADREKISKSKQGQGGYQKPQTSEAYVGEYGADIVRLWVSSQDYRNDIVVSEKRIQKVAETYRHVRNALRYQLSNLYDFDPSKDAVDFADMLPLDRWILDKLRQVETDVRASYEAFEFHQVYQRLSQFVAVELSAIYHDLIKDRMYTDPAGSSRRRSGQTAQHLLVQSLCRMLSPILAYTADEAWEQIPGTSDSVHLEKWAPGDWTLDASEIARWETLFPLRDEALQVLEAARRDKVIGKSLEARLTALGSADALKALDGCSDVLREILNVSQFAVKESDAEAITFEVSRAEGEKCARCWHLETDIGSHDSHPTLCGRCVDAVS